MPDDLPAPFVWDFSEPQPGWRPAKGLSENMMAVEPVRVDDALRLPLTAENHSALGPYLAGAIYVDLPDWTLEDWAYVEIRARAQGRLSNMGVRLNYDIENPDKGSFPFFANGDACPLVSDGTVQTYRLSLNWADVWPVESRGRIEGPWTDLAV